MNILGLVGGALRLVERGAGALAGSSQRSPGKATSVFGAALLGLLSISPDTVHAIGSALSSLGGMLQSY